MALQQVQATVNGQVYILTLNEETGRYEAQITAPSLSSFNQNGQYYDVSITATDDAGNVTTVSSSDETLGDNLKLIVKETVAPVIAITSHSADQILTNNKPTITFTVTDNDSGVNTDTITVLIDGIEYKENITKVEINDGYNCEFTVPEELADGSHTIQVQASDNDGNEGISETINITIDTVPPELAVTTPINGYVTNVQTLTVVGTTNDSTTIPVSVTINGEAVNVSSDGSFSHTIELAVGTNKITVIATDSAGHTSEIVRTVTYDISVPVFKSIEITPNPVTTGSVFTISVSVDDL